MIVRRLRTAHALLAVLAQPTAEMETLRCLLCENGLFPPDARGSVGSMHSQRRSQHTLACSGVIWSRWSIPGRRPDEPLLLITPSCAHEVGNGITSSESKASFHTHRLIKKRIGPASGWHALVYGWKLHLVSAVAAVWIPLAAQVTPANVADSDQAPFLLRELPLEVRFVLGDRHYHRDELNALCFQDGRLLVTTRYGRYPHADAGVEVPRMFHKLRASGDRKLERARQRHF